MTILPRTEADYVKTSEVVYSMSLNEREVRRIGERRYTYPRRVQMALWIVGPGIVITIVGSTIQTPTTTITKIFGYILLAGMVEGVAAVTYFFAKANRAGKKLLEEQKILKGGNS